MSDDHTLWDYQSESLRQLQLHTFEQVNEEEKTARGLTFISDQNPLDTIDEFDFPEFTVKLDRRDAFAVLDLQRRRESSKYDDGYKIFQEKVYLFSNEEEEVFTAYALSDQDFYLYGLRRFFTGLPGATTSFLSTSEIKKLLSSLESEVQGDVIVEEAVIKSPNSKTDIQYLNEPYYSLFSSKKVAEDDYFVDKVQFRIKNGRDSFSGFLSRNGDTRFTSGSGSVYFQYLLRNLSKSISEKGQLFVGKSREYGSREAERLEIEYDPGEIKGVDANQDLIDTLRGMTHSSVTVYHSNPYMHASILDFEDGSTADVFITSDRKISIIPGFSASRSSLTRICDSITQGFGEGEVQEGENSKREFDSYFSGGQQA
ncbi:hypothetical protein [Halobacterium sp. KA-6]|uniref:hypothetical protein n=1 Tax=Halobacterium sp. KA-6 TaxID=2896368 RepID=UPI001E469DE4|nr:hypothetical protein [Halobacterium sp. KA-6]MCD2204518.1 hypothetical protein [Halobacterium sp. KA-6]